MWMNRKAGGFFVTCAKLCLDTSQVAIYGAGFPCTPFSSLHTSTALLEDKNARQLYQVIENIRLIEPAETCHATISFVEGQGIGPKHDTVALKVALLENVVGFLRVVNIVWEILKQKLPEKLGQFITNSVPLLRPETVMNLRYEMTWVEIDPRPGFRQACNALIYRTKLSFTPTRAQVVVWKPNIAPPHLHLPGSQRVDAAFCGAGLRPFCCRDAPCASVPT